MKSHLRLLSYLLMELLCIYAKASAQTIPTFTIAVGGNEVSEICLGVSALFTCTSNNTDLTWTFGDGSTATSPTSSYSFKQAGTYTVTLKDNTTGLSSNQTLKINSIPHAEFSASTTSSCTGNPITLTSQSTSTTPIVLYKWDMGDGTGRSTTISTINYSYNSAGNFTPSLTAQDENGCTSTSTGNFNISIGGSVVDVAFQANGTQFYSCSNSIELINTTNENGKSGIEYVWDLGDGQSIKGKNPNTYTYSKQGVYTITLKASYGSNTGCSPGFSKTVYIGQPDISINIPDAICASTTFKLNATTSIASFVTTPSDLKWQIENATIAKDNLTASFKNISGDVNISVTNINGCPNTATKNITIKEIPNISISMTPNIGICTETITTTKAVLNNGTSSIQAYVWDPGDGSSSVTNTIDSFQYQYTKTGTYKLKLNATNVLGCTNSAQITVTVNPNCIDNGYGSTYNPIFGFYSKSCDDKYTITIYNKNPEKRVSKWTIDNITANSINDTATISLPAIPSDTRNKSYEVYTFFTDGTTDLKNITIINESANFNFINTENATKYCAGNSFSFNTDTSVNAANLSSLNWIVTNTATQNKTTLKGRNPKYIFPEPGIYTVMLTTTDLRQIACTSTITKTIDVKGLALSYISDSTSFCYTTPNIKLKTSIINSNSPVQSITWNMGDGNTITAQTATLDTTFSYQYNYTGTNSLKSYRLSVTASDASGCKTSVTNNSFFKIYNPKVGFYTADTLLCSTRKVIINNTSSANGATYIWRVGGLEKTYKSTSDFNNTFNNIAPPSTMDVYLQVKDGGGCVKDTIVKNYIKFVYPKTSFEILNKNELNQCPPFGLLFKNNTINASSYKWTIQTETSTSTYTTTDSLYFTVQHPGKTNVSLESYIDGCTDTMLYSFTAKGPIANLYLLDTIGCTPFISRMKVEHNDDVVGYQWDFGDSTASLISPDADSVVQVYRSAGTFTPRVIVSGAEGCTDELVSNTQAKAILVSPQFQAFNVSDKCSLDTPKFLNTTNNNTIPIEKFIWNWGKTEKEANQSFDTIYHSFAFNTNSIPVSLTAITDICTTTSDTLMIVRGQLPIIAIKGLDSFCNNKKIELIGVVSSFDDSNYIYNWYNSQNALIHSGKDSVLNIAVTNDIGNKIRLEVVTEEGCKSDIEKSIQILEAPIINLKDSVNVCHGDTTQIHAISNGIFAWTSQEAIYNKDTPTPSIFPNKNVYYYLSVTKDNGCVSTDSVWVQVDTRIGVSYQANYKGCMSDSSSIKIAVQSIIPCLYTWTATPDDHTVVDSTSATILVRPSNETIYHFIAHSNNSCPDESGDITLQYTIGPTINFTNKILVEPAGTILTLQPEIANLDADAQYTWYPDFRMDNRYLKNPTIVADKDITYILKVIDKYGCPTSDSIQIKVLCNASKILMSNAFTPNGDGKNDRFYVTGYGIANVVHFIIIDRWGKKVFEKNNIVANDISQGWDGTINGKQAEPGTYLYIGELECMEGNKIPIKGSVVLIR